MAADVFAATVQLKTSVRQTLGTTSTPAGSSPKITHGTWDFSHALGAATTPPLSKHAAFQQALDGGAATIELTALPGFNSATVDGSGLKVQAFKARNPSTNANSIALTFGAANPYLLAGVAWKVILEPGMEVLIYGNDKTPDIAAGAKNIDLAGTGVQALDVEILMG